MNRDTQELDVAVVGGGLAGLAAAATAARLGGRVALFERSVRPGGRARTHSEGDYRLNLGPHALYDAGQGMRVLRELGVRFSGGHPRPGDALAYANGRLYKLPTGARSLLASSLFTVRDRLEYGRIAAGLGREDVSGLNSTSLAAWLDGKVKRPRVRAAFDALFRLGTYSNAPEAIAAGAALRQFAIGARGVTYVDGGWESLVTGLAAVASGHGARLHAGLPVRAVEPRDGGYALVLDGGATVQARSVIIALPLPAAAAFVPAPARAAFERLAAEAVPARASCLDICVSRLPEPGNLFALGLDEPLYLSVHSAVAKLAPAGHAVISMARYTPAGERETDPEHTVRKLEALLDLVQPGWRALETHRQFLPDMLVQSDLPRASIGGEDGRPGVTVPGMPGLYVAGDWVGPGGMLSDVSLTSGRDAGRTAIEGLRLAPYAMIAR